MASGSKIMVPALFCGFCVGARLCVTCFYLRSLLLLQLYISVISNYLGSDDLKRLLRIDLDCPLSCGAVCSLLSLFVRSSSTGRTTWTGDGPGSRGCGT